jgi:hypothetical protein
MERIIGYKKATSEKPPIHEMIEQIEALDL